MSSAPVNPAFRPSPVRRLSVKEYHRMIDGGILVSGEPYELLNGQLVLKNRAAMGDDPMTVGHEHLWAVKNLGRLGRKLDGKGCHMQTQGPVILSSLDEPEPDGVILVGTEDDYKKRKPAAKDATCVIEVSDSSLDLDRTDKLVAYANSGIPQYVIINLPDRVIEVYTEPQPGRGRYGRVETIRPGGKVALRLPKNGKLELTVRLLLP